MEDLTEDNLQEIYDNINAKIDAWIQRGEDLIFPEKWEDWKNCVEARAYGIYHGRDLDTALDVIKMLNGGSSLTEAQEFLDKESHSKGSYAMATQIIFSFSKQGPEFLEFIMGSNIPEDTKVAIENKKKENLKYTQTNSTQENEVTTETDDNTEGLQNEEAPVNDNQALQVVKETFFTKIINFIKKLFPSKQYENDTSVNDNNN